MFQKTSIQLSVCISKTKPCQRLGMLDLHSWHVQNTYILEARHSYFTTHNSVKRIGYSTIVHCIVQCWPWYLQKCRLLDHNRLGAGAHVHCMNQRSRPGPFSPLCTLRPRDGQVQSHGCSPSRSSKVSVGVASSKNIRHLLQPKGSYFQMGIRLRSAHSQTVHRRALSGEGCIMWINIRRREILSSFSQPRSLVGQVQRQGSPYHMVFGCKTEVAYGYTDGFVTENRFPSWST